MTQNDLRQQLATNPSVRTQIATPGDGSPEIAWGDTFFYACDASGQPALCRSRPS